MSKLNYFTSESVLPGHPDKLCDYIADSILDKILQAQSTCGFGRARSAVEVMALPGGIVVGGEVTCDGYVDIPAVARQAIKDVGYDGPDFGFDGNTCAVLTSISEQSQDIANAVVMDGKLRAGDQGLMFGYATNETPELMPLPIMAAHFLAQQISKAGNPQIGPDGKTQVTVVYDESHRPVAIDGIVVSMQHTQLMSPARLAAFALEQAIRPLQEKYGHLPVSNRIYVNPSGQFVKGGPCADSGLTGRKVIVDTYGGMARHGGGAFSGKDPTKLDRTGAYMARHIARSIVTHGDAKRCEVQLAYVIGHEVPISVRVDSFGTGDDALLESYVKEAYDLRPSAIIERFDLFNPHRISYAKLSAFGHFGRCPSLQPWEANSWEVKQ